MYGEATTVSTIVPNRATRDKCIGSCAKAPLKKCEANTVLSAPSTPGTAKLNTALMYGGSFTALSVASTPGYCNMQFALPGCAAVTVYSIVPNRATAKTVSAAASIRH